MPAICRARAVSFIFPFLPLTRAFARLYYIAASRSSSASLLAYAFDDGSSVAQLVSLSRLNTPLPYLLGFPSTDTHHVSPERPRRICGFYPSLTHRTTAPKAAPKIQRQPSIISTHASHLSRERIEAVQAAVQPNPDPLSLEAGGALGREAH